MSKKPITVYKPPIRSVVHGCEAYLLAVTLTKIQFLKYVSLQNSDLCITTL
jgi:hypothetical protein